MSYMVQNKKGKQSLDWKSSSITKGKKTNYDKNKEKNSSESKK